MGQVVELIWASAGIEEEKMKNSQEHK